ncbi:LRR receptor-like serine/threonine-protein kinase RCH1 [Papaver somniferum]|uniref:LRR receptor-like serine/threonine-protein kinase RCH1 n=1 Tax=Papaver somniferum TaxID=3469 RepID=UPI000E6FF416|nr:LRR receptor-like serine/threonine-protein kinase RCH1 [Papaver somniferum]
MCPLTNLEQLVTSRNSLTGTIPSCLFKLKYLRVIDVSKNKFHGLVPFPPKGIKLFILSGNKFSGEISLELGRILSNAYTISIAGNELSGSIPFILCQTKPGFTFISYIDLSNNKLSGTIPSNIGHCRRLSALKLGNNNLTGKVPDELKLTKSMSFLQLNNNYLDGTPLNLISEFHELKFLNLANNNFRGGIPTTLGSLKYLRFLSLSSNNFKVRYPGRLFICKNSN